MLDEYRFRQLMEDLRHRDPTRRFRAAETLSQMGTEAFPAIPALQQLLYDPDVIVAEMAVEALGNMGEMAILAIPTLIRLLRGPEDYLRKPIAYTLAKIGAVVVPSLVIALYDKNPATRIATGLALRELGQRAEAAVPSIAKRLATEENPQVQQALLQALEAIATPAALKTIRKFTQ